MQTLAGRPQRDALRLQKLYPRQPLRRRQGLRIDRERTHHHQYASVRDETAVSPSLAEADVAIAALSRSTSHYRRRSSMHDKPRSLSIDDWARAALEAVAEGGLDAVAVEPLARRLGVTKGSFYWHFANREALIREALTRWEQEQSTVPIERAEKLDNPRDRLYTMFREIANAGPLTERVLLVLVASDHPLARAAERKVSARWRGYAQQCFEQLGFSPIDARHRASFAFAIFVGNVLLRRDDPEALPAGEDFQNYLRFTLRALMPPAGGTRS